MDDWFAIPALGGLALWAWYWRAWVEASKARAVGWFSRHAMGAALGFTVYLFIIVGAVSLMQPQEEITGGDWFVAGVCVVVLLALAGALNERSGAGTSGVHKTDGVSAGVEVEVENQGQRSKVLKAGGFLPQEISFLYEDANGNLTNRMVDVERVDGDRIEGFCHDRSARRTFRIDRMMGEVRLMNSGEKTNPENLLNALGVSPAPQNKTNAPTSPTMEVLFTGFDRIDREPLEDDARAAGMVVRKSVTKNLTILVAGPKCGPRKREQAELQGAAVVDEEGFYHLIDTGELMELG